MNDGDVETRPIARRPLYFHLIVGPLALVLGISAASRFPDVIDHDGQQVAEHVARQVVCAARTAPASGVGRRRRRRQDMSDQSAAFDEKLRQVENEVVHILIPISVLSDENQIRGNGSRVRLDLTRLAQGFADLNRNLVGEEKC